MVSALTPKQGVMSSNLSVSNEFFLNISTFVSIKLNHISRFRGLESTLNSRSRFHYTNLWVRYKCVYKHKLEFLAIPPCQRCECKAKISETNVLDGLYSKSGMCKDCVMKLFMTTYQEVYLNNHYCKFDKKELHT